MGKPTVRLALDSDGEAVRKLVERQHGAADYLDWSHIAPYWLVAEIGGEIVGALQTCPSRPIGRLEMLSMAKGLKGRARVIAYRDLVYAGLACIKAHGGQQAQIFIPEDFGAYREFLEGRGLVVLDTGHMLAKRLI